jgi:organic hydroperoxide reductase OsmC/OhrA
MSEAFRVEMRTVDGGPAALGAAGPLTLVADRPADGGGAGIGFNGGQLLNLAVAACVSNDLYREAVPRDLSLTAVRVRVDSDYGGDPAVSSEIVYDVELEGNASEEALDELLDHVDRIAEIPNSLRRATAVTLGTRSVRAARQSEPAADH